MLSRRVLRGVISLRSQVVPRKNVSRLVPAFQTRFYSDNPNANAGANGNATNGNNGNGGKNEKQPAEDTPEGMILKLKKDLEDTKLEVLLAIADRQNSIRIAKEDVRKAKEYGTQKLVTSLLDVNDNMHLALDAVKPEKLTNNPDLKNFYEGVQMTSRQLTKVLEMNDVKRFSPMGQKFDPNLHQALQEVEDPSKENGTICYVMKSGYQLKDRLLRPASVVVVRAKKDAAKQVPKDAETPKEEAKEEAKESDKKEAPQQ